MIKNKEKSKLILLGLIGILFVLSVYYVYNNSTRTKFTIKKIQDEVQLINNEKNYQIKTLNNQEFLPQITDGGGQLVGYFKNGNIVKVSERLGLSAAIKTVEYYFTDGKLIYVYDKEEDFPYDDKQGSLDYTKLELAFEGYHYFNNERLIFSQTTGKKRYPDDKNLEALLLKNAKENIDLLSK